MELEEEVKKLYEGRIYFDLDYSRGLIDRLTQDRYSPGGMPSVIDVFPITCDIERTIRDFVLCKKQTGKMDEELREYILKTLGLMEDAYKSKKAKDSKTDKEKYSDWITIEVFPGARHFFKEILGFKEYHEVTYDIHHWVGDFKIIERYLLGGEKHESW